MGIGRGISPPKNKPDPQASSNPRHPNTCWEGIWTPQKCLKHLRMNAAAYQLVEAQMCFERNLKALGVVVATHERWHCGKPWHPLDPPPGFEAAGDLPGEDVCCGRWWWRHIQEWKEVETSSSTGGCPSRGKSFIIDTSTMNAAFHLGIADWRALRPGHSLPKQLRAKKKIIFGCLQGGPPLAVINGVMGPLSYNPYINRVITTPVTHVFLRQSLGGLVIIPPFIYVFLGPTFPSRPRCYQKPGPLGGTKNHLSSWDPRCKVKLSNFGHNFVWKRWFGATGFRDRGVHDTVDGWNQSG